MYDIITNGTDIKTRIISEINNASKSILLAMAFFTDKDIANAIIAAKKKGAFVDVILSSNAQNETVKQMFTNENISLHSFETGDPRGMMHHKFCLIDNRISINGSYNYSYNASQNNVENIQVSDDITIYKQLQAEFDKLKYKIDNEMDVNSDISGIMENNIKPTQISNSVESFTTHLGNLIYSTANINTEVYKLQGYENAKESSGNIDIFTTNFNEIKENIKLYATDDSLTGKKNTIIQHINAAFENKKEEIDLDKDREISIRKSTYDIDLRQLKNKIEEVKKEKSIIEAGNETTGEKGLIQINNLIEKLKLERKGIESTIPLKKFWNPGTILSIVALSVLVLYLAIFFSSAIYKVLIEESRIMAQVMIGQAEMPKIINANAFYDIKNQEGWLFAIIAILFFTIPVLLSNLKLFVKDNKWAKYLGLLIGVLIFDVIVAFMVAKNTNHIRNLVTGEKNELNFWEVPLEGEFWLIFIFGMFPLIITHYIIDYLLNAYQKSQSEIVDADKTRKIRVIDQSILDLNSKKEILVSKLAEKEEILKQNSEHLDRLEKDLDFQINEVKNKYHEIFKNIKSIYDDFISRITSGRIFTEEIFKSVYIAYKTGFIEYLTELYSEKEVSNRTRVIEQQINHNF